MSSIRTKSILFALLILLMLIVTVSMVFGEDDHTVERGTCGAQVFWTLDQGELVVSGSGPMSDYKFGRSPFFSRSISSVTINSGVTSIGDYAFANYDDPSFYGLTSATISIADSVTHIGIGAFLNQHLTNIVIPESVTSIGESAFSYCNSLTHMTIPGSVKNIGDCAFYHCTGMTSVTMEYGVESIGLYAFAGCSSLTDVTIPNSVTVISQSAFTECTGLTSIEIPSSLTEIEWSVFSGTGLTSVTIPSNISKIGDDAFAVCRNLASVTIESGVTSIGDFAFWFCESLTSVVIPDGVTSIDNNAFAHCTKLTSVTIPSSVLSIGYSAFSECTGLTRVDVSDIAAWCNIDFEASTANPLYYAHNLYLNEALITNLDVPDNVECIGNYAFLGCTGLKTVTLPNCLTSIGNNAFERCTNLMSVTIPSSVLSIGYSAFSECTGLTRVDITDIAAWCNINFDNMSNPLYYAHYLYLNEEPITNLSVPDNVECIGRYAFVGCAGLKTVTIPNVMTSIGYSAFDSCDDLTDVYYHGNEAEWNNIAIGNNNDPLLSAQKHFAGGSVVIHTHSYTSVVTKEPTCNTKGVMTFTCSCGDSYTEEIPIDPNNHAALNENGDCSRCGKHIKDVEKPTESKNEETAPKLNIFQRIIQWFKNLFAKLFGR